eukprot:TCONS_00000831-protein
MDAFGTSSGVPHIVVEKIIDFKVDNESSEPSYRIKWEDTWVPENVMQCMFPDLLQEYKNKILQKDIIMDAPEQVQSLPGEEVQVAMQDSMDSFANENNSIIFNTENSRLLNALDLIVLQTQIVEKIPDSLEILDLNSTDLELCQLIKWRGSLSSTDLPQSLNTRSKRTRKPSMKMSECDFKKRRVGSKRSKTCTANKTNKKNSQEVDCPICGRVIRSKRLDSHMLLHSKDSKFSCETCGKVCGTRSDLRNHMLIHGEYNYECPYCDQKFKQPAPYRVHMKMHTVENNWMCDVCFETFKFQGELKQHCMSKHKDISKDPQRCCVCKELLKSPISVYKHSVGHSGIRNFVCGICSKRFKHKSHLEKHLNMHERMEKEKTEPPMGGPFNCQICGREFLQLQSMKIHLGKHKANQETNLEEYLQKKAQRLAASKEKNRQNARIYKAKYKEKKATKMRILQDLGIEPDNPIAKTVDLTGIIDNEGGTAELKIVEEAADQPEGEQAVISVNKQVEPITVGKNVVLGSALNETLEYVVATDSTSVVVGDDVAGISVENMAPGFALLSFLKQSKTD